MSGGSLNYFYSRLEDHVGDFGDKELDDLVKDLADLFHDREWYLSADYGKGTWIEARDAFKAKWFTEHGRLIDADKLMMSLADWWYSSFGEEETDEAKAIRTVMDKIEQSIGEMTVVEAEGREE